MRFHAYFLHAYACSPDSFIRHACLSEEALFRNTFGLCQWFEITQTSTLRGSRSPLWVQIHFRLHFQPTSHFRSGHLLPCCQCPHHTSHHTTHRFWTSFPSNLPPSLPISTKMLPTHPHWAQYAISPLSLAALLPCTHRPSSSRTVIVQLVIYVLRQLLPHLPEQEWWESPIFRANCERSPRVGKSDSLIPGARHSGQRYWCSVGRWVLIRSRRGKNLRVKGNALEACAMSKESRGEQGERCI